VTPALDAQGRAELEELAAATSSAARARSDLQRLAEEQAALRRVAEIVAQESPADEVLHAVAVQASRVAGVDFTTLLRYEPDGSTEIVAVEGAPDGILVGMRAPGSGDGAVQRVWRTGRAGRIDNLATMSGHWTKVAHGFGFSTSVAVPILIQGRLWGALVVVGRKQPLARGIDEHLTNFAELAGTAISAAEARKELRVLADEQAALRRVAELVARGAALDEVFAAVATEASTLLGDLAAALLRYDGDGDGDGDDVAVAVAVCNSPAPLGLLVPSHAGTPTGEVLRTGRPVRVDGFESTALADIARELGVGAGIAVPVVVEGRVWGTLTTSTPGPPLPSGTEDRLAQLAELAAAAIANAENKAKLTASRARVVATADETRRRLQRDVHDSAQQRLVHTIIALKLARTAIAEGGTASDLVEEALANAERASSDLRDIVRGILPASLTRGGLRAGLESFVADVALPVDLQVTAPRLAVAIETTAYFIVAEALTNVVKHARASHVTVEVAVNGQTLSILVRDDGVGGAGGDPGHGTGLTGLLDRVEAAEGTLTVTSPEGLGTTLHATLPIA
jgi:signal transduction histidine kinase